MKSLRVLVFSSFCLCLLGSSAVQGQAGQAQDKGEAASAALVALNSALNGSGSLVSFKTLEDGAYSIEARYNDFCLSGVCEQKPSKCSSKMQLNDETKTFTLVENSLTCSPINNDNIPETSAETVQEVKPVELVHEIQQNDQYPGSGEQFVAVRRDKGKWCAGCPIDVNPDAEGVDELVKIALQNLNKYVPKVDHFLKSILRLQKQVELTTGVRYTLLMEVDGISCKDVEANDICENQQVNTDICQVAILEKPWLKSVDGSKFKIVVTNNCTEEYFFNDNNILSGDQNLGEDEIKKVYQSNVQAGLGTVEITPERLKDVEEQIIPNTDYDNVQKVEIIVIEAQPIAQEQIVPQSDSKLESQNIANVENKVVSTVSTLSDDKMEALDGLLNLFGFESDDKKPNVVQKDDAVSLSPNNESNATNEDDKPKTNDPIENAPEDSERFLKTFSRKKRNNKSDNYHLKLAESALRTLDGYDKENVRRVVLDILSVEKSKKSPSIDNYEMRVVVGVLKCKRSNRAPDECLDFTLKQTRLCNMFVEVKSDENENKVERLVQSGCAPFETTNNNKEVKNKQVKKRQAPAPLIGGSKQIDPNDPKVVEFADKSLKHYELTSSNQNQHKVVNIISASKQLVAGVIYKIEFEVKETNCPKESNNEKCELLEGAPTLLCTSKVWNRPWLNDVQINITCNEKLDNVRNKRQLGGYHKVDPKTYGSNHIMNMVERCASQYDQISSNKNRHKVTSVISAEKRDISGTRTLIRFEMKETNCLKSTSKNIMYCDILDKAPSKLCFSEILKTPGLDETISVSCEEMTYDVDELSPVDYSYSYSQSPDTNTNSVQLEYPLDLAIQKFDKFINDFNRTYIKNSIEYKDRLEVFRNNLKTIDELNESEQGTAVYGINKFADVSQEEFKNTRLGLDMSSYSNVKPLPNAEIPNIALPTEFDWRKQGAVTPVKDQGQCGSCWAFSVTGNIEGQYKIKNGTLLSLSEQELVDCDKLDEGCNGGLPSQAYQAIQEIGGLETEKDYPYDAEDETCHFNKSLSKIQVKGGVNISSDEQEMAQWLVQNGPLSIGINANAMQFYMGGISHPLKVLCSPKDLDHGVLIVGFGVHKYPIFNKIKPFWIVKNSWGPSWGESGYYRVYRGDGTCGLNQMVTSAVL